MTDPNPDTTTSGGAAEQSIAVAVQHNPVIVLIDERKRDELFAHIEKELAEFTPDLTTTAGRETIRRFAAKITKTKTAADKAGLDLTAEAREKIATINGARKVLKERLEALADRARQPLTDWEEAEQKRVTECEAALVELNSMGVVPLSATAEQVEAAIATATNYEIDPAKFQGMTEAAIKARNHTLEVLKAALERIQQQEAERAELERLRAEAAERLRAEAARDRLLREQQIAAEKEQEAAREKAEAEERAKAEAEEAARREAEERQRAHEEALRAEREAREAAEAEARAAQERAAAAAREQEEARQREEAAAEAERQRIARIEADEAHRTKCKREAKEAIMTTGVSEDQAQKIVLLIIAGEVPRTKLDFAAPARERVEQPALV